MRKNILATGLFAMALACGFASCSDDNNENGGGGEKTYAITQAQLDPVIQQVVNNVILPTYKDLASKNDALNSAVQTFRQSPSDANFEALANAWLAARQPWETSEAFLWGPVADKGLDPNMDSWPLDQSAIVQLLQSQQWNDMEWSGDYNEDDDNIAAKQEVRGFHTLEYLTFFDGKARTISATSTDGFSDPNALQYGDAVAAGYGDAWGNYMQAVGALLRSDANSLYSDWSESFNGGNSYAEIFKSHDGTQGYQSALNCIEALIDGCTEIASEVGSSKIGDPISKYEAGQTEEALYAVESWYSWHSRDDYTNNIYSIRNVYYGSLDGTVNSNSMSAVMAKVNSDLDTKVKNAISTAAAAIQAIPQPFRSNINSAEAKAAMDACGDLEDVLNKELKPYFQNNTDPNE